jgi:hypothetical protein
MTNYSYLRVGRHNHVRLMYDLSDGIFLIQKIVVSSVLPIIKVLTIEDHKLRCIFLHIAFRSQSLLESTSDQTTSDTK